MKNCFQPYILLILVVSLLFTLASPSFAVVGKETKGITTKSTYTLIRGVSETSLTVDGEHNGYMLQIAPTAKASLKASFSKYFTDNSTKASRSKAAPSLGFSTMTTTAHAAAYEQATGRNVI